MMKARKRSLTRCVQCQSLFRPHLWGRESGKGPVCDQCSNCDVFLSTIKKQAEPEHVDDLAQDEIICFNCSATKTSLWRRDGAGKTICNACGLYYKLHRVHRPPTMMKPTVKRRKRYPLNSKLTELKKNESLCWALTSPPPELLSEHLCRNLSFDDASSTSTDSSYQNTAFTLPPIHSCSHEHSIDNLHIQRHELQLEISRLSMLLSSTIARISEVDRSLDQAIAKTPCDCEGQQKVSKPQLPLARLPPISFIERAQF